MDANLFRNLNDFPSRFRHGALSIGNFDGVHLGHARLVERLLAMAAKVSGPAVVFTFDPHPAQILRPQAAPTPLAWIEQNALLLRQLGVDAVVAYPTDEAFLQLDAASGKGIDADYEVVRWGREEPLRDMMRVPVTIKPTNVNRAPTWQS